MFAIDPGSDLRMNVMYNMLGTRDMYCSTGKWFGLQWKPVFSVSNSFECAVTPPSRVNVCVPHPSSSPSSPPTPECSSFSPPATVILLILLCFEALLFLIFTSVMFGTQVHSICTDETVSALVTMLLFSQRLSHPPSAALDL